MTDLLGTPSLDTISRVRNEKARRYLSTMRKKQPIPFSQKFPNADPLSLKLLERLLAFDPKDRPTAEEALADPYFKGLAKVEREPSCQPITKMEFEFERRRVTKEDIRELIFHEILEYHPQLLKDYANGTERTNFLYPSAVDQFKKQFAYLEENGGKSGPVTPPDRKHVSLPRSTMVHSTAIPPKDQTAMGFPRDRQVTDQSCKYPRESCNNIPRASQTSQRVPPARPGKVVGPVLPYDHGSIRDASDPKWPMRNSVPRPESTMPSSYCFHQDTGKPEITEKTPVEAEQDCTLLKQPQSCLPGKIGTEISVEMRASPFHRSGGAKSDVVDRLPIEANLIHSKSPFLGIATAVSGGGAHRKISGMSRMY